MLKFQTRVMVASYVLSDAAATAVAWLLAYFLRSHADPIGALVPVTKGVPPLADYLVLLPLMALVWPTVLYFHGLYRVRRGRSRIDELFAIVFSVLIASALTLGATLYVRVYYRYQPDVSPRWEYSQAVFAVFVVLDVVLMGHDAMWRVKEERDAIYADPEASEAESRANHGSPKAKCWHHCRRFVGHLRLCRHSRPEPLNGCGKRPRLSRRPPARPGGPLSHLFWKSDQQFGFHVDCGSNCPAHL